MWDSQPLHSPARFTHAKEQTLRHLLEGKPPQSTQAGRVDAPQHPATSAVYTPCMDPAAILPAQGSRACVAKELFSPMRQGAQRSFVPQNVSSTPTSPQATWPMVNWALIWARSWIWDLLRSNQPKVCHDVHNVCHGRSSQAATISSLVKHWNRLPGKRWNPHLWNYLRDVWTGH